MIAPRVKIDEAGLLIGLRSLLHVSLDFLSELGGTANQWSSPLTAPTVSSRSWIEATESSLHAAAIAAAFRDLPADRHGLLALLLVYAQRLAHGSLRGPIVEYAFNEFKELNATCNSLMGLSRDLRRDLVESSCRRFQQISNLPNQFGIH